jgi:hypothetical protein
MIDSKSWEDRLKKSSMDDVISHSSNRLLTLFLEKGGLGLKEGVYLGFNDILKWKELKEKENGKENIS